MRNGNLEDMKALKQRISSYRTYEEWKPEALAWIATVMVCSYRTYEEWKLATLQFVIPVLLRSYRTYEEWKPSFIFKVSRSICSCSYRTYEEWKPLQ